jgi:hypothetical protein
MNMGFQQPHGIELPAALRDRSGLSMPPLCTARKSGWLRALHYLGWFSLIAGLVYMAANAGTVVLLTIAGAFIGLLALATGACIYVMNNTW